MIKVITTDLLLNNDMEMLDHQSRIIEVESWDDFVEEIKTSKLVYREPIFGNVVGYSIGIGMTTMNLDYDDFHLSCDIIASRGDYKGKILAYIADR